MERFARGTLPRLRRGSSLVEVLLGVWILAFAVLGSLSANVSGSRAQRKAQNTEVATQAARAMLDEFRTAGFEGLPAIAPNAYRQSLTVSAPAALPAGSANVQITRVNESDQATIAETGRRRLEVTVRWSGRGSDQGTVKLVTLLARYGDS